MFQDMAFAVLKYFPHVIFCSSSFHRRGGFSSRYSTSISCVHWGCMTGVFTFISSVNMQECEDYAKMGFWLLLCSFHDKKKKKKACRYPGDSTVRHHSVKLGCGMMQLTTLPKYCPLVWIWASYFTFFSTPITHCFLVNTEKRMKGKKWVRKISSY